MIDNSALIAAYEATLWMTIGLSPVFACILWNRRTAPGAVPLLIQTVATTWWALCYVMPLPAALTSDASGGLFFRFKMIYFGVVVVCPAFLMIALQYTGRRLKDKGWLIAALCIEPVLVFYAVWNSEVSPQFFGHWEARPEDADFRGGILFWLHTAYNYGLAAASMALLVQHYRRGSAICRQQVQLILLSMIAPVTANIVAVSRLTPFVLDVTPLGFFVGAVVTAVALLDRNLFDVIPVARETVLECMDDGILVLDKSGHAVDANPAAYAILDLLHEATPEAVAAHLLPQLEMTAAGKQEAEQQKEIELTSGKTIDLRVLTLKDRSGMHSGRLLVMRDISALTQASRALHGTNERLRLQLIEIEAMQKTLREQAVKDPLTGLFNRRFLEETLQRELANGARNGISFCVAMLDVDHFKRINDDCGHAAGDAVLKALAALLQKKSRKGDAACRFGGEEFVVIFCDADEQEVCSRVDEWRQEFSQQVFHFSPQGRSVTFSAGVAAFPLHGTTGDMLLRAADQALYDAKENGRNRVSVARLLPFKPPAAAQASADAPNA